MRGSSPRLRPTVRIRPELCSRCAVTQSLALSSFLNFKNNIPPADITLPAGLDQPVDQDEQGMSCHVSTEASSYFPAFVYTALSAPRLCRPFPFGFIADSIPLAYQSTQDEDDELKWHDLSLQELALDN